MFDPIDWASIFTPTRPLLEIIIRGTLTYFGLFFLIRFVLRRESETKGLADLLVVVLIADAVQNGMAAEHRSVIDGLLLAATLIFWTYSIDWLAGRSAAFARLVEPPPAIIIKNGRMLRNTMKDEKVTEEELMTQLREHGVEQIDQVRRAYLEHNGQISVIKYRP